MKWRFSGKQNVYLEIAEQYKQYIALGVIRVGEKLPSVRNAAGEMGVNPNTMARAYSILEEEGYVRSLPKKGIYVIWDGTAPKAEEDPDKREVLIALRDMGIRKETVLKWIEEVYEHD